MGALWLPLAGCNKDVISLSRLGLQPRRGDSVSARIFSPLLMLLAHLPDPEPTKAVQFLKEENKVLRT